MEAHAARRGVSVRARRFNFYDIQGGDMTVKKIDSSALRLWVDRLIGDTQVVGVKAKGDSFAFCT